MKTVRHILNEKQDRTVTYNPFDLFFKKKIKNGAFVTVGYVKDASEESPKLTGQKGKIVENDPQLQELLVRYHDTAWAQAYSACIDSPAYEKALSGKVKTFKFNIEGEIIRIQKFQYQWRDAATFAKRWEQESDEYMKARVDAGFGEGVNDWDEEDGEYTDTTDDAYDETDWRRKSEYMGSGVRPRGLKKNASSGYRFQTAAPGLYSYSGTDETKYDRMAIRNQLDTRFNQQSGYKSEYYYVTPQGKMELMPDEFVTFMKNAYKTERATRPAAEMEQAEAEYNAIVKAIAEKYKNKQPTDLLFDQILYISASPVDWNDKSVKQVTGQKMAFINNRALYQTFPFLRSREVNNIIVRYCTDLDLPEDKTIKDRNARLDAKAGYIERVTESKKLKRMKDALYESIMLKTSKILKKHLNEMYDEIDDELYSQIDDVIEDEIMGYVENGPVVLQTSRDHVEWCDGPIVFSDYVSDGAFVLSDICNIDMNEAFDLLQDELTKRNITVTGFNMLTPTEARECYTLEDFENPDDIDEKYLRFFK